MIGCECPGSENIVGVLLATVSPPTPPCPLIAHRASLRACHVEHSAHSASAGISPLPSAYDLTGPVCLTPLSKTNLIIPCRTRIQRIPRGFYLLLCGACAGFVNACLTVCVCVVMLDIIFFLGIFLFSSTYVHVLHFCITELQCQI